MKKRTRSQIKRSDTIGDSVIGADGDQQYPCTQPFTVTCDSEPQDECHSPDHNRSRNESAGTPTYEVEAFTQPFVVLEDISKLSSSHNSLQLADCSYVQDQQNIDDTLEVKAGAESTTDAKHSNMKNEESRGSLKSKDSQGSNKSNVESQLSNQSSILCEVPLAQQDKRKDELAVSPVLETQNSGSSVEFISETKRRSNTPSTPITPPQPTCLPTRSQLEANIDSQLGSVDVDSHLFAKPLGSSTQITDTIHLKPPATESDEQFRKDVMSDSYVIEEDDVWPCVSPPTTPAFLEQQLAQSKSGSHQPANVSKASATTKSASKSADQELKTVQLGPRVSPTDKPLSDRKITKGPEVKKDQAYGSTDQQSAKGANQGGIEDSPGGNIVPITDTAERSQTDMLSWSTLDFNSQPPDKVSGESNKSASDNHKDVLPPSVTDVKAAVIFPSIPISPNLRPGVRKRKCSSESGSDSFVLPSAVKQLIGDTTSPLPIKPLVDDDIVNQSWSERSDTASPAGKLGGVSPTVSPPRSPKRKCRLGIVVKQALHLPEYADALSTIDDVAASQESKYVDCASRLESEESFTSAVEEPTSVAAERDNSTLNVVSQCYFIITVPKELYT